MMKTLTCFAFTIICCLVITAEMHAQYSFEYDDSGNRTNINIATLKTTTIEGDSVPQYNQEVPGDTTAGFFADRLFSGINIYPNPTTGQLKVEIHPDYPLADAKIIVYNSSGIRILTSKAKSGMNIIDLIKQPSGTYFMKIYLNPEMATNWKIIKQ